MALLSKSDLIHQYYVEELPVQEIAERAQCSTETVRLRRTTYDLRDRDRDWTQIDTEHASKLIRDRTSGASLIGDMRTLAFELQHKTSVVKQRCQEMWLRRYAPHVDIEVGGRDISEVQKPQFKLLTHDEDMEPPSRSTAGSAGMDLQATIDVVIRAGEQEMVPVGISTEFPEGWVGLICPRSGLAAKHGITIQNAPGIIDSDFRGEYHVILYNTGTKNDAYKVVKGDRIAQLLFIPCFHGEWALANTLNKTARNTGGFGSTGK